MGLSIQWSGMYLDFAISQAYDLGENYLCALVLCQPKGCNKEFL